MKKDIQSPCKSASSNICQTLSKLSHKIKKLCNDMLIKEVNDIKYGDEMIPLAKSCDQRSTKKEKMKG